MERLSDASGLGRRCSQTQPPLLSNVGSTEIALVGNVSATVCLEQKLNVLQHERRVKNATIELGKNSSKC